MSHSNVITDTFAAVTVPAVVVVRKGRLTA